MKSTFVMNLPSDPQERRRITALMLQQKFGNTHGFQPQTARGAGHDDEVDDDDDEYSARRRPHYDLSVHNRHVYASNDLKSTGINNNPPNRSQRQWKVNCNQHAWQATKAKQVSNITKSYHGRYDESGLRHSTPNNNNNNNNNNTSRLLAGRDVVRNSKFAPLCAVEDDDDLACEVRRRLSLPSDTQIPGGFLANPSRRLILSVNNQRPEPLSRIDRRQSLMDIGFGKLATYTKLHALGAGTYSIVYKGSSRLTNRLVALKEIHLEREEGVPFTAIREVSLLKQLRHCNIITLHDLIYADRTLTLVFEFVDRDLSHYMDECDHKINLNNVRLFLFQLLRAISYCHDRKILHRDIKPQNILISAAGELKLADFGLARARTFPTKTYTDEVVTLWYRPPDVLLGNITYGFDIDMWGVGCIFFEMVAGFTLFLGVEPKKQVACIFEILGTPSEREWPNIDRDLRHSAIDIPQYRGRDLTSVTTRLDESSAHLLKSFLKCNPRLRISSNEAMRHEYFSSFPPEVYNLSDSMSILSLPALGLEPEEFGHSIPPLENVHV